MKKFISIVLVGVLLVSSFSIMVFAVEPPEDPFSLENYTFNDLKNMSIEEKLILLDNYQRVYMPETYQTSINFLPQPLWESGNQYGDNSHEFKTHELVTLEAIVELENYLNNYEDGATELLSNSTEALAFALALSVASALPDRVGQGSIITGFVGHFYNPETGKNYLSLSSPTAKTNAISKYNSAFSELNGNYSICHDNNSDGLISLGYMLHFVQDACEPHHSSNVIANPINNSHEEFEEYVSQNIDSLISCSINHNTNVMTICSAMLIGELVHLSAPISHSFIASVNNVNNKNQWYSVADGCIDTATSMSAISLYKILKAKNFI